MLMSPRLPRALVLSFALHCGLFALVAELRAPTASQEKGRLAARLNGGSVMHRAAIVQTAVPQDAVAPARGGAALRRSTVGKGQKSTMPSPISVVPEQDAVEIRLLLAAALAEGGPFILTNLPVRLDIVWQAGGRVLMQGDNLPLATHAHLLAGVTDVLSRSGAIARGGRLSLEFRDLAVSGEG